MDPVTVHANVAASREEVFDVVVDMAVRVAFTDHYVQDFHLTRPRSTGVGAAARFKVKSQWAETAIVAVSRPHHVREEGRAGRLGRIRTFTDWTFESSTPGIVRVEQTYWTEPPNLFVSVREGRMRRHLKRRRSQALERLRRIFEEDRDRPLLRATVAGWEPGKAARFGSPARVPTGRGDQRA